MDLRTYSNDELKAFLNRLEMSEWQRNARLMKKKKRHEGIDFSNPRHEQLKKQVKQEIEKRGLHV